MSNKKGFVAISTVLVISAIILIIGLSIAIYSVNYIQTSLAFKKSEETLGNLEGCVEEVLLTLNEQNNIPITVNLPQGVCNVTIQSHTGSNWVFTTDMTVNGYKKSIRVTTNRSTVISVTEWNEN